MIDLYRTIWRLLDPRLRRSFVQLIALMMLSGVFDLAGVAVILPFLIVLANPEVIFSRPEFAFLYETFGFDGSFAFLQFLGMAIFILVIGGIALRAATSYLINRFVRSTVMSLSHRRLRGYLAQPYEWFLGQHSAQLSKSVLQEITEVVTGTIAPAVRLIANGFLMILLVGFLIAVEPVGALVIGTAFLIGFLGIYRMVGHRLSGMGRDRLLANRERQQVVGEVLRGIKEVKVLGLERYYLESYLDPSRRLARYQAALALIGELPRYALEALAFGGMLMFVLYLLWSRDGALAEFLPIIGAFSFAAIKLMPTSQVLFKDLSLARYGTAALQDLDSDLTRLAGRDLPARSGTIAPMEHAVVLSDIRYRYPGAERDALRDVTLRFPAGQAIGLAGATGAGKSTIIDLLLGLITPNSGRLTVDDTLIGPDNIRAWQDHIGYVPQTIHLVDDTLAANIAPGVEIDRNRVAQVASLAALDDVIATLPQGLDTPVGDDGIRLSGGQRQRIGIARALYRDPYLLVLDEATSALDVVTEAAILRALQDGRPNRTFVMITHRLHSLSICDTVYFLRDGAVAASGTLGEVEAVSDDFRAMRAAAE